MLLQEQPAFLLVTDLASVSQEAIVGSKLGHVQEVMQACIMYNLSVRLPIAFMAELRVQQVCAKILLVIVKYNSSHASVYICILIIVQQYNFTLLQLAFWEC